MNETQIEKAEQLLSYFEAHPDLFSTLKGAPVGAHNEWWTTDAAALLRDLLPEWSAFKELQEVTRLDHRRCRRVGR